MATLKELKKKKAMLLKKAGLKSANMASIKQRQAEEKKLKAEIYALEHPESARAREVAKNASSKFGSFIKRNASLVAKNAVRLENERKARARADREKERELEKLRLKAAIKRKGSKKKVTKKKKSSGGYAGSFY